jgi:exodeoxyribonuclease V alpha subunit
MNLKKNMSEDMKKNCITIHKLLEYQPIFYEVYDPETGETKTTMKFQETRNQHNPLPPEISTIVIDESSMASVDLFNKVANACSHKVQFIFLGDIQQLPPTFGSAILGFKMLELPTVELTTVYRQALESPIIRLAHRILSGNGIPHTELDSWTFEGQLKFNAWKKKLAPEAACIVFGNFITKAYDLERYDPEQDMILCPFNVNFGTDELNKIVAQHLAKKYNRQVHEVIAGFNKKYFSVGEKVLYEREDAEIIRITLNPGYSGTRPQLASTTLSYWGLDSEAHKSISDEDDVDFLLHQMSAPKDVEERVNVASHTITVRLLNSEEEVSLQTASEINSLLLGYALTVHKSQGSEWRRVFLALHQSHATMCSRELLYTAVTRAKEELYIVCEKETFVNGIKSQRIKGNTLAEKAEFFKGKKEETKILA